MFGPWPVSDKFSFRGQVLFNPWPLSFFFAFCFLAFAVLTAVFALFDAAVDCAMGLFLDAEGVLTGVVLIFFLVGVFIGVELISFFDGVLILEDVLE